MVTHYGRIYTPHFQVLVSFVALGFSPWDSLRISFAFCLCEFQNKAPFDFKYMYFLCKEEVGHGQRVLIYKYNIESGS